MLKQILDPLTLTAFTGAAAGHDGVLSDESGHLVIKPCTPAEIAFYESANAHHKNLAAFMPTFLGTLQLSGSQNLSTPSSSTTNTAETAPVPLIEAAASKAILNTPSGPERAYGKRLDTDQSIVLANVAFDFRHPNILDLKLGAQLWDSSARPEKRAKLDKIAAETTSSSLGFRIAGMRTWQGKKAADPVEHDEELKGLVEAEESGYWVYNKMYGRKFNAQDVIQGFAAYVLPPKNGEKRTKKQLERARECLELFVADVERIKEILENEASRMYSASLLFVYEGDAKAFDQAKDILENPPVERDEVEEDSEIKDDEGDEEDEEELPKLATVKLIDFAHAKWTPGQGADENSLRGIRNTIKILRDLINKVKDDIADI
ncbi:SAICAR synthase-like protein [Lepidopterella palustris CBS 459.81]|uniref:Kinase n=1 Tax=Lepidopterella palustris CBS 459.81 TaxID=1314670 RepID=A0A8E2EGK4_9PEZI|nr:SAICAR synthase-like protein [Lepidopterella palustris CBS 459.81]